MNKRGQQPVECPECFKLFNFDNLGTVLKGLEGQLVNCPKCNNPIELYIGAIRPSFSVKEYDEMDQEKLYEDIVLYKEDNPMYNENINYNDAKKIMEEVKGKIEWPKDMILRRKNRVITVNHFDGSVLKFNSACFRRIHRDWIAIYTEHHGNHLYHVEDLHSVQSNYDDVILFHNTDNM